MLLSHLIPIIWNFINFIILSIIFNDRTYRSINQMLSQMFSKSLYIDTKSINLVQKSFILGLYARVYTRVYNSVTVA